MQITRKGKHGPAPKTLAQRLWSKCVPARGGCIVWTGSAVPRGYGRLWMSEKGGKEYTHRISWILHNGPIPRGMSVLHRCDNPPCVRPDHLFLGSQADNVCDMVRKGRSCTGNRNGARTHRDRLAQGERHWRSVLSDDQRSAIRELYSGPQRLRICDIAKRFGVGRGAVRWTLRLDA
jgi:hypothetical protein